MAKSPKVTAQYLASNYHVTKRTIWDWVEKGLPKYHDGPHKTYFLLDEAIAWHERFTVANVAPKPQNPDDITLTDAQKRKILADAERAEIKLRRERGEFGSVQEFKRVFLERDGNVRAAILAMPTKCAARIPVSVRLDVKRILEEYVREILSDLAQTAGSVSPQVVESSVTSKPLESPKTAYKSS